MQEKITDKRYIQLGDLFAAKLGENLIVGDKLLDIRTNANSVAKMASDKLVEDGEFAKVYAESIADWLEQISNIANDACSLLIDNQKNTN